MRDYTLEDFIEIRNTDRLHNLFKKLNSNEKVNIVFFGASISSGFMLEKNEKRFSTIFEELLKAKYPNADIKIHNPSLPGTPSNCALNYLFEKMSDYEPDLVFLEFATNDPKHFEYQTAYESMMYYCINLPTKPAVMNIICCSNVMYTCKTHMDLIAENYQQSSIFVCDAINNVIDWDDYSNDYIHPNQTGHIFIANMIYKTILYCESLPLVSEEISSTPIFDNKLSNLTFLDSKWDSKETASYEYELECEYLYLVYFATVDDSYGDACLYVDGKIVETLKGYEMGTWDRPVGRVFQLGNTKEKHTITLKMNKGEENKNFLLQKVAYV